MLEHKPLEALKIWMAMVLGLPSSHEKRLVSGLFFYGFNL
jgi:hypothetical protein